MSLYAAYLKERHGAETLEHDQGFLDFIIRGEECFLRDIFVTPEARGGKLGSLLVEKMEGIALSRGCKRVTATIVPGTGFATEALHAALHIGLRLQGVQGQVICLMKEIHHG